MKNLKKIALSLAAAALLITSCKYEDGVGISLVSKRDRLANEWRLTGYDFQDGNSDSMKNLFSHGDSLEMIFTLTRNDNYHINLQYTQGYADTTKWHKLFPANMYTSVNEHTHNFTTNPLVQRIGNSGKYTFDKRHDRIQIQANLSESYYHEATRMDIRELRKDKLKLEYFDYNGKKHTMSFEARNKEPKQFK